MTRQDLPRRKPLALRFREEHDTEADTFAVTAAIADPLVVDGKWFGGFIKGWSTFTPEVQEIVRADLRAIAEREVREWRAGTRSG